MIDPYYCKECHCYHDRHVTKPIYFDFLGDCFAAEKWRMDNREEIDEALTLDEEWTNFVNSLDIDDLPVYKIINRCGHMTFNNDKQPMGWCRDCRERRETERYDY